MKRRAKASGFIERTLLDIASVVQRTVSLDAVAARRGFLQACDPRVKLASFAVLLAAVLVSRGFAGLSALYAATLVLALVSSVSLPSFLKRTLPFIPLFSLLVVAPAIFGFVTPGEPVARFSVFGFDIDITRQGLLSAGIILLRVLVSVSLSVLLVLTTRRHALLKALRVFRVPEVFVMTMGMTYRYIYLLLEVARDSFTALKSRVGCVSSSVDGQKVVGLNMGALWMRSWRLQGQVYDAMVSRGYAGAAETLDDFRLRALDAVLPASSAVFLAVILWLNASIR